MSKVFASITTSVDGYVTGPDDGPGKGLGEGGERLHYWVFGGPVVHEAEPETEPGAGLGGFEKEWMDAAFGRMGRRWPAAPCTRQPGTGATPTRGESRASSSRTGRRSNQRETTSCSSTGSRRRSIRAKAAAGDKDVSLGGGADVIRQALELDLVDDLSIVIAPVVLGGGKRLFDGFTKDVELEHLGVHQSPYATFIDYAVKR